MNTQERFNELKEKINFWKEQFNKKIVGEESYKLCTKEYTEQLKYLQKEIENKNYGCNKLVVFWDRPCGMFEDLKHSWHIILCPTCQKEKELDAEILKQIKEMLK